MWERSTTEVHRDQPKTTWRRTIEMATTVPTASSRHHHRHRLQVLQTRAQLLSENAIIAVIHRISVTSADINVRRAIHARRLGIWFPSAGRCHHQRLNVLTT